MITLEKEKTVTVPFKGVDVSVRYKVPTAVDAESILNAKLSDCEIFKNFTLGVSCDEIEELNGAFPSDIISLPGVYPLVNKVAWQIVNSATVSEAEKN